MKIKVMMTNVLYKINVNTLRRIEVSKAIQIKDIATNRIFTEKLHFKDEYTINEVTDSIGNIDDVIHFAALKSVGENPFRSQLNIIQKKLNLN